MSKTKELIVVTSGTYQLLHFGHLNLLRRAKCLGDKLIVLLNSDRGTLELKGYLAERFEVRRNSLLQTGLVDKVLEFDIDPTELLQRIRPDFFVVGSDHTKEEVMAKGGKFVDKIVIFSRTKGVDSRVLYEERKNLND